MTEDQYILITNKTKLTAAIGILRDVLPGDGWGIEGYEMVKIMRTLKVLEERMIIKIDSTEYDQPAGKDGRWGLPPCPFCGTEFRPAEIKKHYIGEVFDSYQCPGCKMQTPTLRCGGFLQDWWETSRISSVY